jgi:Nucleotide modification associated domain 2
MKIYIYTVPVDDGAAPNPYGDICTLAICKPNLRKIAKVDDWIIGLNSKCKLIYTMKITTVQTMKEYDSFTKENLKIKVPNKNSKNIQEQMGDSVYDFSNENITLRPSVHSRCTKDMDLAGKNVLLSKNFYYFGNQVQKLPKEFDNIVNIDIDFIELDENLKELFFNWLENQNFQKNKIYSTPHVIGIISPSNRELKMSCCIRKKVEENYN